MVIKMCKREIVTNDFTEKVNIISFMCEDVGEDETLSFNKIFNVLEFDNVPKVFYIVTALNLIKELKNEYKIKFIITQRNKKGNKRGVVVADQNFVKFSENEDSGDSDELQSITTFSKVKVEGFTFKERGDYSLIVCWNENEADFRGDDGKLRIPRNKIATTFDFSVV